MGRLSRVQKASGPPRREASMPKKTWDVSLDDEMHTVDLDHGESMGRVKISVDGEQVMDGRTSSSTDFRFKVAGHSAVARIEQKWLGFAHDYTLVVNGQVIP